MKKWMAAVLAAAMLRYLRFSPSLDFSALLH